MLAEKLLQELETYIVRHYQPPLVAPERPARRQAALDLPSAQPVFQDASPLPEEDDDSELEAILERYYGRSAPAKQSEQAVPPAETEEEKLPPAAPRRGPLPARLHKPAQKLQPPDQAASLTVGEELAAPEFGQKEQATPAALSCYVREHHTAETFSTCLLQLIDARGLTDAAVYKAAGIDRRHFAKIRSNRAYQPKKGTVLALTLALRLAPAEAEHLLNLSGYSLSQSDLRDVILRFCLEQGVYALLEVNEALAYFEQKPLSVLL